CHRFNWWFHRPRLCMSAILGHDRVIRIPRLLPEMTTANNNPLLDFSGLPRFREIRPEHVGPALDTVLADNRRQREALLGAPRYTWESFAQPIEDMNERLSRLWSPVSHLNAVVNNDALRAVYNENLPRLSEYYTEMAQDERLYAAYRQIVMSPDYPALSQ